MKKKRAEADDDPLDREIDFTNGVRGKYAAEFGRMKNVRVLAPDLLDIFPDSESVNKALRAVAEAGKRAVAVPQKISARTAATRKAKK